MLLAEASQALAGLDGTEIEQIALLQLVNGGAFDPQAAAPEQARRVSAVGLLDMTEPDTAGLASLGDWDGLKT